MSVANEDANPLNTVDMFSSSSNNGNMHIPFLSPNCGKEKNFN